MYFFQVCIVFATLLAIVAAVEYHGAPLIDSYANIPVGIPNIHPDQYSDFSAPVFVRSIYDQPRVYPENFVNNFVY